MARGSTTPLKLAHVIADELASDGVHGTFRLSTEHYGDEVWHQYEAELKDTLSVEEAIYLFDPFQTWLSNWYDRKAFSRVLFVVQDAEGNAVDDQWRSITRTNGVKQVFDQLPGRIKHLSVEGTQSAHYLAIYGVSVSVEVGGNFRKNGRLY